MTRSYVFDGIRTKVEIGSDKRTMANIKKGNNQLAKILRGESIYTNGRVASIANVGRVAIIKALMARDGIRCNNPNCPCNLNNEEVAKAMIVRGGIYWIQIDHKDDNHNNNCLSNMQILCSFCNQSKRHYYK